MDEAVVEAKLAAAEARIRATEVELKLERQRVEAADLKVVLAGYVPAFAARHLCLMTNTIKQEPA